MDVNVPRADVDRARRMVSSAMYAGNDDFFRQFLENRKVVSFYKDLICAEGSFRGRSRVEPQEGWWDARHLSRDVLRLDMDGMDELVAFESAYGGGGLPMGLVLAEDHYRMEELKKLGPIAKTQFDSCKLLRYISGKYDGEIRIYVPGGHLPIIQLTPEKAIEIAKGIVNYKKN